MTAIADALEALRDTDGLLRIEKVLAAAANPDSALHEHINWDDGEAAHAYRLSQVRELIRAQKITVRIGPAIVKSVAYVQAPGNAGAYTRLDEVQPSSALAHAILANELGRVEGALSRAKAIAAALDLTDEVDALIEAVSTLRTRAAAAAPSEGVNGGTA